MACAAEPELTSGGNFLVFPPCQNAWDACRGNHCAELAARFDRRAIGVDLVFSPLRFEDVKKGAGTDIGEKFGDLIIWKEMIDKAKAAQQPMIFVTDDAKSDWWHFQRGRKIGPHPELVEEFLSTTGQQFHIHELVQFLKYAEDADSGIHAEVIRRISEAVLADSEIASRLSNMEISLGLEDSAR